MHSEYRSPINLSRITAIGLGLVGFCSLAGVFIGIAQIASPETSMQVDESNATSVWFFLQGLLAIVQFPVYVATAVFFLIWLHRTYTNLPALRSESNEFTPGWAVGWWFIPFANLIKPFQAVRNVWAESDPDFDPEVGFLSRIQEGAPAFMIFWWAFWLVGNFVGNITYRLWDPEDPGSVETMGYLFILDGVLWTIGAILAIRVLWVISSRQEQRHKKISDQISLTPTSIDS